MKLRRSEPQQGEDVRWLAPTRIRQPRPRYGLIGLLAVLLLAASAAVIGFVVMGGGQTPAPGASNAPAGKIAAAPPPEPAAPPDTPATRPLSPVAPVPAPRVAEPPVAPAPEPEPSPPPQVAETPPPAAPVAPTPPAADVEPDQGAPASSVAGAFPAPSEPANDDPEAPNFAVYLNEAAPDEAGARALLVEAQRKYASALEGGRLSYRRVRVSDGFAWRLRLSGLTRSRAQDACEALTNLGAGCEVGPR